MAQARRRSVFRPCIDLHNGEVKQIVGGTLHEDDASRLKTNFIARYTQRASDLEAIFNTVLQLPVIILCRVVQEA